MSFVDLASAFFSRASWMRNILGAYCLWGIGGHMRAFGSSTCDKDPTVDVLQAVKILKMLRCLEFAGSLFPFDCESGAENNLDTWVSLNSRGMAWLTVQDLVDLYLGSLCGLVSSHIWSPFSLVTHWTHLVVGTVSCQNGFLSLTWRIKNLYMQ